MFSESNLLQSYVSEYIGLLDDCINEHLQRSFGSLMTFSSSIKSYLLSKFFDLKGGNDDHLNKFKQLSVTVRSFLQDSLAKEQSFIQKTEIQFTGSQIPVKEEKRDVVRHTVSSGFLTGIPKHIIEKCLASKSTAMDFFTQKMGLYIPLKKDCNIHYIRGLLEGTKKALKQSEINDIRVPFFEEFQVDKSWNQLQKDEKFMQYMPYKAEERPNRKFFYNVYNTLYPDKLADLISRAYVSRNLDSQDIKKNFSPPQLSRSPSLEKPKQVSKYFQQLNSTKERKQHERKRNQFPELNFLPIDIKSAHE